MSQITVLKHSSIHIQAKEGTIYIDPYQIEEASHDAEYIFITHSHYDHFSPEDIEKIKKPETKINISLKDCACQLARKFQRDVA